jgi:hypothetical protein
MTAQKIEQRSAFEELLEGIRPESEARRALEKALRGAVPGVAEVVAALQAVRGN